jgi:hypothetical protein
MFQGLHKSIMVAAEDQLEENLSEQLRAFQNFGIWICYPGWAGN